MTRGWIRGLNPDTGRYNIRALHAPGFRRYAAVQLLSATSVASQMVAELWLVYQITGQGLSLGTSTAIRTAPALVLAGVAGTLADRYSRKLLLTLTQAARCVLTALFVLVALGDLPSIGTVYLLVLGLGCVQGIDQPVRRAIVRDVVSRTDLPSAASLHTATISTGGIIGPLCAGLLMTTVDPVAAFVFSSASALAAVAVVQTLRLLPETSEAPTPAADPPATTKPPGAAEPLPRHSGGSRNPLLPSNRGRGPSAAPPGSWRDRSARIWTPQLRPTYLLLLSLSIFAMNVNVLLPLIAAEILDGGSGTYSVLHTFLRAGALAGSLAAAASATRTADHRRTFGALVLCGAALVSVGAGTVMVVAAITIVATGIGAGRFLSMAGASVQTGADRAVQGRQVAMYSVIFVGGRSLGALLTGWLADTVGTRWTTVLLGAGTIAGALAVGATTLRKSHAGWTRATGHAAPSGPS